MGTHCAAHRHRCHGTYPGVSRFRVAETRDRQSRPQAPGPISGPALAAIDTLLQTTVFSLRKHRRHARTDRRVSTQRWIRLRKRAKRFALERRSRTGPDGAHRLQYRPEKLQLVSLSDGYRSPSRLYRSHQSLVQRSFPATSLLARGGIHACFFAEPCELLQSGLFLVRKLVRALRFQENAGGVSHRAARYWAESIHNVRRPGQYLGPGKTRLPFLHQRQSRLEPWRARVPFWNQYSDSSVE